MARIIYVVTVPGTAYIFLKRIFTALLERGHEITLISSPGPEITALRSQFPLKYYPVDMQRRISPVSDIAAIVRIYFILRKEKPSIVNYSTPKAGLLASIAAIFARTRIRIYELRGLRLEGTTGPTRTLLAIAEHIISFCSTSVICVSQSLYCLYRDLKLASPSKLLCFGRGFYYGADPARLLDFRSTCREAQCLRDRLCIPKGAKVIGYIGRLNVDKGIVDLYESFLLVDKKEPIHYLLLVGELENQNPIPKEIIRAIRNHPRIRLVDKVDNVAPFYHLLDIFAFPSYREGLPNAPIEAAFASLPTIGYSSTGIIDAVINGKTGILVPPGSVRGLENAILMLLHNDDLRKELGTGARSFALQEFLPNKTSATWMDFYSREITKV